MKTREDAALTIWFQRVESAVVAVLAAVAFVELGFAWWYLPLLFLLFDASMVGYVRSPRLGAWTYNAMEDCVIAGRDIATYLDGKTSRSHSGGPQ